MKKLYFTLTFSTILFAINIAPAFAQTGTEALIPESNYKGHGIKLSDAIFASGSNKSERIAFYNVGRKRFLNAGGLWGTAASTYTSALSVKLEKTGTDGVYKVETPFFDQGHYMGYFNDGYGEMKVFLDRGGANDSETPVTWSFKEVAYADIADDIKTKFGLTNEDKIYKIELVGNNQELVANQNMNVKVYQTGNRNLIRTQGTEVKENQEYTYWKIVDMDEIEATMLTDTHIYATEPSDITFLIRAQDFNRQNVFNRVPGDEEPDAEDENIGWKHTFKVTQVEVFDKTYYVCPYTNRFVESDYKIDGLEFKNNTHGDIKFGMFYCAQIKNSSEVYNNTTYKVSVTKGQRLYQTVSVTRTGWYRIDCQGFFYNGEGYTENCCAELFAYSNTGKEETKGTAEYAYVNLLPQRYLAKYQHTIAEDKNSSDIDYNSKLSDLKSGNAPKNHLEAGVAFYTNEYPNSVLVYVSSASKETPASITFGIQATRDFEDNDVVWADNFNLKYLGQSFALDERKTLTSPLTDNTNNKIEYIKRPMVLRRTLNKGKWNPIVLPVDLTKAQVNTTFFPLPLIAEFKGFKDANTLLFKIIDLTDPDKFPDENTVAMEAGHCYLINSGYEGHSGSIMIGDADGKTMRGPYYVIDRVTYTEKPEINIDVETPRWSGTDCELSIVGTYEPDFVPKWSFLMDNSTLWHINDTYKARGYSWWIEDKHQKENPAQAHLFTLSAMDSGYDEVTGLYEVKINNGSLSHHNDKVYNLQGIEVNGNAALPKGIYISNGKKFIVK